MNIPVGCVMLFEFFFSEKKTECALNQYCYFCAILMMAGWAAFLTNTQCKGKTDFFRL